MRRSVKHLRWGVLQNGECPSDITKAAVRLTYLWTDANGSQGNGREKKSLAKVVRNHISMNQKNVHLSLPGNSIWANDSGDHCFLLKEKNKCFLSEYLFFFLALTGQKWHLKVNVSCLSKLNNRNKPKSPQRIHKKSLFIHFFKQQDFLYDPQFFPSFDQNNTKQPQRLMYTGRAELMKYTDEYTVV